MLIALITGIVVVIVGIVLTIRKIISSKNNNQQLQAQQDLETLYEAQNRP